MFGALGAGSCLKPGKVAGSARGVECSNRFASPFELEAAGFQDVFAVTIASEHGRHEVPGLDAGVSKGFSLDVGVGEELGERGGGGSFCLTATS